jgi:CO/xanthine dehydrogenase FAD-binding subunit
LSIPYEKASTIAEAVALRGVNKDFQVLAGGTDLIAQWRAGLIKPSGFLDISSVEQMHGIVDLGESIEIGAITTHTDIVSSAIVGRIVPVLAEACGTVGAVQIQNRGTIGGNIMNASPAGDTLPVLLAYGAEIVVQNISKKRTIPIENFFTDYRKTALASDELLMGVHIKKPEAEEVSAFFKVGQRKALAISKVSMCVRCTVSHGGISNIVIALGSVAAIPIRAFGTETLLRGKSLTKALIGEARRSIMDEIQPIDDIRSTADYRRFVIGNLLTRFLSDLS